MRLASRKTLAKGGGPLGVGAAALPAAEAAPAGALAAGKAAAATGRPAGDEAAEAGAAAGRSGAFGSVCLGFSLAGATAQPASTKAAAPAIERSKIEGRMGRRLTQTRAVAIVSLFAPPRSARRAALARGRGG
jgi:hypothetical protein